MSSKLSKELDTISSDPNYDRTYINTQFFLLFPQKYIKKQAKKGLTREQVLTKFRDSNRYETMKGSFYSPKFSFQLIIRNNFLIDLYEYRVLGNGQGDVDARKRLFKLCFRTKLNNWWSSNASKITS